MNNIEITLLNTLDKYFNHLSNFGSMSKINKEAVLITLFIYQMLEGPMSYFISNKDYSLFNNLMYCLNGKSCLVDYSEYCQGRSIHDYSNINYGDPSKILEQDRSLRVTRDGNIRFHIL